MSAITPARAFAIEIRAIRDAVKRGEHLTPFDVLDRLARAADQFASHTEHGVPMLTAAAGEWKCCE